MICKQRIEYDHAWHWMPLYWNQVFIKQHKLKTMFLPCFTGDQVSRRGALTGGYYDTRKSRLDLQKGKMECIKALNEHEKEYDQHKVKLQNILSQLLCTLVARITAQKSQCPPGHNHLLTTSTLWLLPGCKQGDN